MEIVPFEISNSMKAYPSVFQRIYQYTEARDRLLLTQEKLDEVSNRIPPTSHARIPAADARVQTGSYIVYKPE